MNKTDLMRIRIKALAKKRFTINDCNSKPENMSDADYECFLLALPATFTRMVDRKELKVVSKTKPQGKVSKCGKWLNVYSIDKLKEPSFTQLTVNKAKLHPPKEVKIAPAIGLALVWPELFKLPEMVEGKRFKVRTITHY